MGKSRSAYLQGTVELLVLKVLSRAPLHGYGIAKWIGEETGGVLELEDAALYQGLHRMEDKGWIEAEWGRTDTGRRAKLYRLTDQGRARLVPGGVEIDCRLLVAVVGADEGPGVHRPGVHPKLPQGLGHQGHGEPLSEAGEHRPGPGRRLPEQADPVQQGAEIPEQRVDL